MALRKKLRILALLAALSAGTCDGAALAAQRIACRIDAAIDDGLLTLKGRAEIRIPNPEREALRDAVFFLYADSSSIVGDEAFFSALRAHYEIYQGRLAGPRSLLEIVQAKAPAAEAEQLYPRWIEGTHGDEDISGGKITGIQDIFWEILRQQKY